MTLLVALGDADGDVVTGVGGGGADSEDLGGDDDVGLEAQLVVGDPHRGVLAVQGVGGTADPLTAPGDEAGEDERGAFRRRKEEELLVVR